MFVPNIDVTCLSFLNLSCKQLIVSSVKINCNKKGIYFIILSGELTCFAMLQERVDIALRTCITKYVVCVKNES